MSDVSRRGFLGSAAFAAGMVGAGPASAEADQADFAFKNNVPDELLAGRELPTFKFAMEKSRGKAIGGNSGKEATVEQLPISKGIAGVSMRLEPGGLRELHWHATAAEWAFVIEGRVRTTVVDPRGDQETNDFGPGDVWYFPRGHGHSLQGLGPGTCHFILIFDNGYFSEFGTFSISDWLGHTPKALLAKNLGLPESAFDRIPKARSTSPGGPSRPRPSSPRTTAGCTARPRPTSTSCSRRSRTRSTRAAASGGSARTSSRSPPRSPGSCSTSTPAASASCTGTPTPTSGNT